MQLFSLGVYPSFLRISCSCFLPPQPPPHMRRTELQTPVWEGRELRRLPRARRGGREQRRKAANDSGGSGDARGELWWQATGPRPLFAADSVAAASASSMGAVAAATERSSLQPSMPKSTAPSPSSTHAGAASPISPAGAALQAAAAEPPWPPAPECVAGRPRASSRPSPATRGCVAGPPTSPDRRLPLARPRADHGRAPCRSACGIGRERRKATTSKLAGELCASWSRLPDSLGGDGAGLSVRAPAARSTAGWVSRCGADRRREGTAHRIRRRRIFTSLRASTSFRNGFLRFRLNSLSTSPGNKKQQ